MSGGEEGEGKNLLSLVKRGKWEIVTIRELEEKLILGGLP